MLSAFCRYLCVDTLPVLSYIFNRESIGVIYHWHWWWWWWWCPQYPVYGIFNDNDGPTSSHDTTPVPFRVPVPDTRISWDRTRWCAVGAGGVMLASWGQHNGPYTHIYKCYRPHRFICSKITYIYRVSREIWDMEILLLIIHTRAKVSIKKYIMCSNIFVYGLTQFGNITFDRSNKK